MHAPYASRIDSNNFINILPHCFSQLTQVRQLIDAMFLDGIDRTALLSLLQRLSATLLTTKLRKSIVDLLMRYKQIPDSPHHQKQHVYHQTMPFADSASPNAVPTPSTPLASNTAATPGSPVLSSAPSALLVPGLSLGGSFPLTSVNSSSGLTGSTSPLEGEILIIFQRNTPICTLVVTHARTHTHSRTHARTQTHAQECTKMHIPVAFKFKIILFIAFYSCETARVNDFSSESTARKGNIVETCGRACTHLW